MRPSIVTLVVLGALGLLGAAATIGLGLYNVSARIEHFKPVYWALHTTYEQNVRLRAPAASAVPDTLDDPEMVRLGAGHYDSACRFCHASPGETQSATVDAMNPRPPHITDAVAPWQPRHLHWIVDNGVKMSGMPHWPTELRNDDVWPVVAFLKAVPGMTSRRYADMTGKVPAEGPEGLAYCATCHGIDGRADGNAYIPRLDILTETYMVQALGAYRRGDRESGIMHQAATRVSADALPELAAYFASIEPSPIDDVSNTDTTLGAKLAAASGGSDGPSCRACHGPWSEPRNPAFPNLAGQRAAYIEAQLKLWRNKVRRGGGRHAELMSDASRQLKDTDIEALANYYANLPASK